MKSQDELIQDFEDRQLNTKFHEIDCVCCGKLDAYARLEAKKEKRNISLRCHSDSISICVYVNGSRLLVFVVGFCLAEIFRCEKHM